MVTISLCMIVKDEEDCLGRCLDSLKDLVDEMIIVDTGSTDRTKEIAKSYGAKVLDYEWKWDFADARNFAFAQATCDYIYSADADEELDEENQKRFRALKDDLCEFDIDIVQMYYCNQLSFRTVYNYDRELRPKLFKRVRPFIWEDPIHEQVCIDPVICNTEIEIIHRPKENHVGRDLHSFRRAINQGRRISKRLHNLYARELLMGGTPEDFIKSKDFFLRSALDNNRSLDEIKEACCILTHIGVLENDPLLILKYALKDAITEMSSEMCYELGEFYFGQGDVDEAIVWYYNAAYECESILDIKRSGTMPRLALAKCYRALGNEEQALDYEREAAELDEA